ncbi:hypothetical protein BDF21DRAFT_462700 [Thamnidium elegans]|uniref:UspA domain-containing protein n=1 Tax=Thamnidium elegans TaxID=101142 RepID=A0A8H7STN5_9FUNG|nr:hypothetical protein INT48_006126 [Thamnidium elegans]KAI8081038.1 hypothetical protein BDF21DRAFT_462700 [Thamnidium elegans]
MESNNPTSPLPSEFFPSPAQTPLSDHRPRVIVIAYDHSLYGDAVISKAIKLDMLRPTDDIRILHIISQTDYKNLFSPMNSSGGTSGFAREDDMDSTLYQVADAFMYEVIQALRKIGFNNIKSEILRGDPKESVTDYCRITKPKFLITGSRGLGAIKRAVMGSVSNYLAKHCPCPVLVVKVDHSEIEARKEMNEKKNAKFADVLASFTNVK